MNPISLPTPQEEYDRRYMMQLIRQIETWSTQFGAPITMTALSINAAQIPSVSLLATLPSGTVYNDAGVLKVKP